MNVVRQAAVLLLAALLTSRGLFAQDSAAVATASPADQVKVLLRPTEIRYVHQESVLLPPTGKIKGLYVNAWAFGSPKLWQLVRLADETEINAFVVDVKDDTGCLLYPSTVPTAEQIGANRCVRAKDARARLDTLAKHDIYAIARIEPRTCRSEEHTSELQSRSDIVCRLLLEKKNNVATHHDTAQVVHMMATYS